MEAEADLEPRAMRLFVVEESDRAAGLVLDRGVIVAPRRRVEQLGQGARRNARLTRSGDQTSPQPETVGGRLPEQVLNQTGVTSPAGWVS
jgi:hypothetical protein